jgi:HK97 family phage portal protein
LILSSILARMPPGLSPMYQMGDIWGGWSSSSGKTVTVENAKNIATAYRCINVLSDDVAKIPLYTYKSPSRFQIDRIMPDAAMENIAWLLEVSPNRYMSPFIFKKSLIEWLLGWGMSFIWAPPPHGANRRELFILRGDCTLPYYDENGNLWYRTAFNNGEISYLPSVEVLPLLINSLDGIFGRSVVEFARESIGRQLGAYETQGNMYKQGLNPAGILWANGELNPAARDVMRDEFEKKLGGSQNAYRLAVMDSKVQKFEAITMKPIDIQFLQGISATDVEICNFFGVPLNKVNMGKQSYSSNEQNNLDYLGSTLDPYLVQIEQAARVKWLPESQQDAMYFKFYRKALLQIDAVARANVNTKEIGMGITSPNEAREDEDKSGYTEGEKFWMSRNYSPVDNPFFSQTGEPIQGGGNNENQDQSAAGTENSTDQGGGAGTAE